MKYYIYYEPNTEKRFATAYEWHPHKETVRHYCACVGDNRYATENIQFDTKARLFWDKRTGDKYELVEPRKSLPNLQFETRQIFESLWEDSYV